MKQRVLLTAEEGMKLTNGEIYGTIIYLADDEDVNNYYEISIEEYNQLFSLEEDMIIPEEIG